MVNPKVHVTMFDLQISIRNLSIFSKWKQNHAIGTLISLYLCGGMEW
jgi:hypothetical protein